jgi:hypothetical protein
MKKISFTISERMRIIALINEFKGNLDTLSAIMDDVKKVKIDEEEWVKAERKDLVVKNEKGEDTSAIQWSDDKGGEKELEFEKDTLTYLQGKIKEKDKAGEITLQDVVLISLNKKLN